MSGRVNMSAEELAELDRLRRAGRRDSSPEWLDAMQGELAEFLRWLRQAQTASPGRIRQLERLDHLSDNDFAAYVELHQEQWALEASLRLAGQLIPGAESRLLLPLYRMRARLADEARSFTSRSGTGRTIGIPEQDFRARILGAEDFLRGHGISAKDARALIAKACAQSGRKDVTAEKLAGAWKRQFDRLSSEAEAKARGEFSPREIRRTICAGLHHAHGAAILAGVARPEGIVAEMVGLACGRVPNPALEKIRRKRRNDH